MISPLLEESHRHAPVDRTVLGQQHLERWTGARDVARGLSQFACGGLAEDLRYRVQQLGLHDGLRQISSHADFAAPVRISGSGRG